MTTLDAASTARTEAEIELLVRAYANQGKFAPALHWSERLLTLNKLHANFYYLRATILLEQEQHGDAEQTLKRALYLDPDFVLAYFALANLYRAQGRQKESEKQTATVRSLLRKIPPETMLPESEGLTAGRLLEIVSSPD